MSSDKNQVISRMEWAALFLFFAVSALHGKQAGVNHSLERPLKWLFYTMTAGAAVYYLYKVIKKQNTTADSGDLYQARDSLDKIWMLSGVFALSQYVGIFYFEKMFKYYDAMSHNILIHSLLNQKIFAVIYLAFLFYYIYSVFFNKKNSQNNGLMKIEIIVLFLLLLPPVLRSLDLYVYGDIIDGVKNIRASAVSRLLLLEQMTHLEKLGRAEGLMDRLMWLNRWLEPVYKILAAGAVCGAGAALIREKIVWQKYLALGGSFILTQYLGILYFDRWLGCFKDFHTANLNLLYGIILDRGYVLLYLAPLVMFTIKRAFAFGRGYK